MIKKEDLLKEVAEKKRLFTLLTQIENEIINKAHKGENKVFFTIGLQDDYHFTADIQRVLTVSGYKSICTKHEYKTEITILIT